MTLPQYYELAEYWRTSPPEHEMAAMLARVFTTWKPPETDDPVARHKRLKEIWLANRGSLSGFQIADAEATPAGIGDWPWKTVH